jgi:hypothetical protein
MSRIILGICLVIFVIGFVSCGGQNQNPPPGIKTVNENPVKPGPSPQEKFLQDKCLTCHKDMTEFGKKLEALNLEQFTAALDNPTNHKDLVLTAEEKTGLLDFFTKWKAKQAEKTGQTTETTPTPPTEGGTGGE